MNIKTLVYLCLICSVCFSCTQPDIKEEPTKDSSLKIISPYPPEETAIVTLKLEGQTLPGVPRVVDANETQSAYYENIGSPIEVIKIPNTENIWIAVAKAGESYVIGWITEDNKLFGYNSEPFVAKNGLDVAFSPGMPVTMEYDMTKPEEGVDVFPALVLLYKKALKEGKLSLILVEKKIIEKPGVAKFEGLARGTFQLRSQSINAEEDRDARSMFLYDRRYIEIEQNKVNRIEAQYPLMDTTVEDGDLAIKGYAYNSVGEPLSGETIKLIPLNDEGPRFDLYYPVVTTDSEGYFEFEGVRPDINVLVKTVGGSINLPPEYLIKDSTLWIDFVIGKLNQRIFPEYDIPDIKVIWKDGQLERIQNLFGKTVVLKVWSSWCKPSLDSLSEFNKLALEYKDNENVVFVAMSIDGMRSKWEEAISETSFDGLRHCWYDLETNNLAFNKPIPYSIIFSDNIVRADGINIDIKAELEKVIEASKEEQN